MKLLNQIQYYFNKSLKVLKNEGFIGLLKKSCRKINDLGESDQNFLYKEWINKFEIPYLEKEREKKDRIIKGFKNKPIISILMPVYNVDPKILEAAVNSIKSQWYKNWELCMHDDGSTKQETLDYLKTLNSKRDSRIKIRLGEKNQNISLATNSAFNNSLGEYIMLMDNDDLIYPHSLYEIVKLINKRSGLDVIYFDEDKLDKFENRIEPFF